MKRFLRLISIFLIPVLFISCRNLFGNDDYDDSETGYVIQGTITQSEVSDAVYRTAFPAQPAGTIHYRITAKCGAETVEEKSTSASTNFSLKIPHAGGWTVFAEGFTDNDFTTSILKSEEKILRISDESPMGYANLVLKPYVSESGTGNVSLRIILPVAATSPRPISSVTIGGIDSSVGITASVTGNQADITGSNVKSGSYTVEISFKGTVSGVPNVLLYHVTEVINVYDNLITDTWVKHGDEPYFDNYGNFMIKDAMTQEFQLTTVYVGGEGANDSNNGTFLNPVATFTKAITISGAKNFFITGEVTCNRDFTPAENGFIKKHPNATQAEILLTGSDTLITIGSGKTFEISNITIAGPGSSSIRTKSGIVNNGNLTLNNSFIKGFKCNAGSTHKGGAINNSTGALTINGGEILGCGAAEGGAIYMAGGSLTIKGTTIIEKNTDKNGNKNNIELASGQTISISGTGTGSHIGITKDFAAVGDSTVQFASDTTENISEKYFSDAGYIIGNTSGKGCIAKTIGVLGAGYYEDLEFVADETDFFVGEGASTITFSAKVGAGTDPIAIDNWSAKVTYAGIDITNRVEKTAAEDKKSYKIVLPSTFPEGKYYIAVRGDYNGVSYSGNEIISISDPDYRNLSAENIESVNMERYAGREMKFIIDDTVSLKQLKALTTKINTSTAKVTLDLSSANLSSMTSSGIVQRNVVKIVLPDSLSSISGSYSLFAYGSYISDVEEFEISSSNTKYCVEDGILYNKTKIEVVCYPPAKKEESFTTSDTVTSIGQYGIAYNRYLKTLVLSKVTTINDYACYKNTKLESCELYKGTFNGTDWTGGPGILNQYAFSGCSALRTITIPATVWRFVGNCFTYCSSLESVTFLRTVGPSFDMPYSSCNEFEGCTNLKHIYVPQGATAGYTTPRCAQYDTWWAGEGEKHWNSLSQSGKLFEPGFVVEVD